MEPATAETLDRGWRTVVVAATGDSFSQAQADAIATARAAGKCRVLAVNDAYTRLPCADVIYACDGPWWNAHATTVRAACPGAELWTQDHTAAGAHGLRYIPSKLGDGLSLDPAFIYQSANSGGQAIGLTRHFGSELTPLVGFDCQRTRGKAHFFGDHAKVDREGRPLGIHRGHAYSQWLKSFETMAKECDAAGFQVLNCTAETALKAFPLCDLDCVLETIEPWTPQ